MAKKYVPSGYQILDLESLGVILDNSDHVLTGKDKDFVKKIIENKKPVIINAKHEKIESMGPPFTLYEDSEFQFIACIQYIHGLDSSSNLVEQYEIHGGFNVSLGTSIDVDIIYNVLTDTVKIS